MRNTPSTLGAFSVSLAVKDLAASRAFYAKLGFDEFGGNAEQNWLILGNGSATIGLFQGMFDSNILTFNPGWDESGNALAEFEDIRILQSRLQKESIKFASKADASTSGPASFTITDPDGNVILVDQHV